MFTHVRLLSTVFHVSYNKRHGISTMTMWFAAGTSTSVYLLLFALVRLGCGQDLVFPDSDGSAYDTRISFPQDIATTKTKRCVAPPQPENGQWRLHPYFCKKRSAGCDVPEGTELGLGYQLIYNCTPGYGLIGMRTVCCDSPGEWSKIPTCKYARCANDMGPGIKISNCTRFGENVKCEEPVLPHTSVKLSCQDGWVAVLRSQPEEPSRYCHPDGLWDITPAECMLQCEPGNRVSANHSYNPNTDAQCELVSRVSYGWDAEPSDFPWHATLYKEKKSRDGTIKEFLCGATIIQANYVMTAAHCVYNENFRTMEDAGKLYVMAGNEYRDYNHPPRREESDVQRTAVKKVNLPFYYHGLRGHFASDIALLELQTPFTKSSYVSPANWDVSSLDVPILRNGAIGKVCGFGRTETLDSSPTLQAIWTPYVPDRECRVPNDTAENYVFIMKDKICAGYTNGTAVCDGDSGGGLMFQNNDKWYVMGIISVSLGVDLSNGEITCAKHALTVYTKVSEYVDWIHEVIQDPQEYMQSSFVNETASAFCASPEQPANGQWKLHPSECTERTDLHGFTDCSVGTGVKLEAGTALVYSCDAGYELRGHPEVYCIRLRSWSNIPECVKESPWQPPKEYRSKQDEYFRKWKIAKNFAVYLEKRFANNEN